jgi:hypothetical protein
MGSHGSISLGWQGVQEKENFKLKPKHWTERVISPW